MLKNSRCVINICCYAPRRMYTHQAHPCFEWYIPSKSPILRELLNVESGNINGGFSSIFGRLKVWICKIIAYEGWSIIKWCMNGVHEWDWVHERFLCPRAAPSGINNCSCTQSHSWTPNLGQNVNWILFVVVVQSYFVVISDLLCVFSILCFFSVWESRVIVSRVCKNKRTWCVSQAWTACILSEAQTNSQKNTGENREGKWIYVSESNMRRCGSNKMSCV